MAKSDTKPKMSGLGKDSKKDTKKAAPKKKAVAKKKTTTKKKAVTKDVFIQTADQVENLTQKKAISMAPDLIDSRGMNDFMLGGVLLRIQENSWWDTEEGLYESFKDYIEKGLGLAYRKSSYLINIYERLVEEGITWDQVKSIGWSKLRFILDVLTTDNVEEWVAKCTDMNSIEIQAYVKNLKTKKTGDNEDEDEPVSISTMTFKVHDDQKNTIREGLDIYKEKSGTEYDTVALQNMAIDAIDGSLGKAKKSKVDKASVTKYLKGLGQDDAAALIISIYPELGEDDD